MASVLGQLSLNLHVRMCVCVYVCGCVCSIVPLEADPSEGKAVSGDSVTIMLAVQQ